MTLRIAVPNKGTLSETATAMLREAGYATRRDSKELIVRYHGQGRNHYAITPRFAFGASDELLDVLTEEEKWLAEQDRRPARSREVLSRLIDSSVYREALAMGPLKY